MNLPTKITFSRIIAIAVMLIGLFVVWVLKLSNTYFANALEAWVIPNTKLNWLYLILFVFFVVASYTDHLDGKLARKNNMVTDLGKFLDPVADKLLINSMVIFLAIPKVLVSYQMDFSFWCAILLVARDIVVDALRFIAAQKGVVIAANIFGKLKTVLEMVAIGLVLLNGIPFSLFMGDAGIWIPKVFVYLATLASVISGVIYVVQNRKAFLEEKK